MKSRMRGVVGVTALAVWLSIAVVGCSPTPAVETPDTLRIAVPPTNMTGSYAPMGLEAGFFPAQAVYESLFESGSSIEEGGFVPLLATGYERSEDWKSVTVTLRDDVEFTDGVKFDAEGLKTYLEGIAEVEDWFFKPQWDAIAPTLTVEDDTTLTIESDSAMPLDGRGFLHRLFAQIVVGSPNTLDDLDATATNPVGSGPYVIESSTPEVGATYVRNEHYRDPDAFPFDTVEIVVFEDKVAALNALQSGQIDASYLPTNLALEAEAQGLELHVPTTDGGGIVLYVADRNGTTVPALADKRVRQAMAYAFDREAINETINLGFGSTSSQVFKDTNAEYVAGGDDRYAYDPDKARQLMAEAGYADGFDLTIPSMSFFDLSSWEPIVTQYLGDIGIRVTFDRLETGAFFDATINTTTYPVIIYAGGDIMALFMAPQATFNTFKVADPVIADLWSDRQTGPDQAADRAASELGEYILEESPVIIFTNPVAPWVSRPGFTVTAISEYPDISQFGVATE